MTVPIFGDQPTNGRFLESLGVGVNVPYREATVDSLYDALQEVLTDPKYAKRAQEIGSLLNDQIDRPMDRAIWHIEHLIRHPNLASFMRSKVHDLTWYEFYQLDVLAMIGGMLALIVTIVYKIASFCCCRSKKKVKTH